MEKIKCTLCGCEKTELIDSTIRNADNSIYKMYKCGECETHFLYPLPSNDNLKEYYNGQFREEVHTKAYYDKEYMDGIFARFSGEAYARVDRVKEELGPDDSILEIGCSVGYFLEAVKDHVGQIYGTEWDEKALSYIKDRIPSCKVALNPPDFNTKFDKVFMFHVLEHIDDPIGYLTDLKELLNPGGTIYVEVPNVDDALVKLYDCRPFLAHYYKMAHLFNYNEKGLRYVMDNAGLEGPIDQLQRYDLSNHLVWLKDGVPGGNGRFMGIISEETNRSYIDDLKNNKMADTLFARMSAK